jgi:dynein heavy chain
MFVTPNILEDGYKFSPSGIYYAPAEGDLESVKSYVSTLPMTDEPEIFGMHRNANISFQMKETSYLVETALSIQPRETGSSGGGMSPDELASQLAEEIKAQLPGPLLKENAGPLAFVMRGQYMDSLSTVLEQEMQRFNRLLQRVGTSLVDLQKAIKGEVLMSDELDRMFTSLLNNRVPGLWAAVSYPSLKPLASWVKDFLQRMNMMATWLADGQPQVFWMAGLFFPQGFMTGTLQNHARKYMLPIDTISFGFEVLEAETAEDKFSLPDDGVLIGGLFMDGARYDRTSKTIEDSFPAEMFTMTPIIHFLPISGHEPAPEDYQCPMYKTSVRAGELSTTGMSTNFVIAVELPCPEGKGPDYWTLKGAAFLLNLDS